MISTRSPAKFSGPLAYTAKRPAGFVSAERLAVHTFSLDAVGRAYSANLSKERSGAPSVNQADLTS